MEQPQSEPPNKRPQKQQMDNENGLEDQDPIDTYMQEQDDGDEMDDSEEEDLVSDLSLFSLTIRKWEPKFRRNWPRWLILRYVRSLNQTRLKLW